jgi:hypothetical protein
MGGAKGTTHKSTHKSTHKNHPKSQKIQLRPKKSPKKILRDFSDNYLNYLIKSEKQPFLTFCGSFCQKFDQISRGK